MQRAQEPCDYECMDCGETKAGAVFFTPDSLYKGALNFEVFPEGWGVAIQDNGDYLLICPKCLRKDG